MHNQWLLIEYFNFFFFSFFWYLLNIEQIHLCSVGIITAVDEATKSIKTQK